MFELGEDLLDGVQVWAIGRQEQKPGTFGANGGSDRGFLVAGKIVQHHNISLLERRAKLLFDPGGETGSVDRLVENEWCIDPITSKCRDEGHGFPVAIRHLGMQALPHRRPAAQRRHVGLCPGLINKDQARRVNPALIFLPSLPMACDLRPQLLGWQNAFF